MKILLIDNYDSFTYNLKQLVEKIIEKEIDVVKNDKIELTKIKDYDKIILSPGPGIPDEAGLMKKIINDFYKQKPLLGVCLGHQAIGEVFGAKLENLSSVFHGVSSTMKIIQPDPLFYSLPTHFEAGRYHSWVVSKKNFPTCLEILAEEENQMIMALKHKDFKVYGVQFHPESILTPLGEVIIKNWLDL